jgi:hypothetical protein
VPLLVTKVLKDLKVLLEHRVFRVQQVHKVLLVLKELKAL